MCDILGLYKIARESDGLRSILAREFFAPDIGQ